MNSHDQRLGTLLVDWQLLTVDDIEEALELSNELKQPLGQVLVRSGYIDDSMLECAIELQAMLRDQQLTFETAAAAARVVYHKKLDIEAAFAEIRWNGPNDVLPSNRLGQLLVDAKLITVEQFEIALAERKRGGVPIGTVLLNMGLIDKVILEAALMSQRLIRQDQLRRDQAIIALLYCNRSRCGLLEALSELGWEMPACANA